MSQHLMKMTLYPSTLFITMKYVYTKKYHTFGNCVCVQNVKCTFLCKLQRLQAKQGIHPDTL